MNTASQTHSKVVGYVLWIFGIGLIYDFWTLNSQVNELNIAKRTA